MRRKTASLVASIVALIALAGEKFATAEYERRKRRGGGRFRRTKRAGGKGSQRRAGVKLIRKMYKQKQNQAWAKLHPKPTHSGANRGRSAAWLLAQGGAK